MLPKEVIRDSLVSRIKNPILISYASVIVEQRAEEQGEIDSEEFALNRLEQLEALIFLQKKYTQRTDILYLIRLSGFTGVVLLVLGLIISIYGWMNGLISVAVAGLGPWAVVIADVLSRVKSRRKGKHL